MVNGFPLMQKLDRICEWCILGKKHRESFFVFKSIKAGAHLQIVHFDLYGKKQTPPIKGSSYFLYSLTISQEKHRFILLDTSLMHLLASAI